MTKKVLPIALAALFAITSAQATPITFDLRGTNSPTGVSSGTMEVDGLTATLTSGVPGTLNRTNSGYGINASASGLDDTDQIDADAGINEFLSITFPIDVFLTELGLSVLSPGEEASLAIGGNLPVSLTDTGSGDDIFSFTSNNFIAAGQSIVLTHVEGNGFSFDNFTVEADSIPDGGSTFALLLAPLCGIFLASRKK